MDGRLQPAGAPAVRADDSAFTEGRGCYTTVRVRAGAPTFAERHLRRLARDARALGLPAPDLRTLARALGELARAAFADGDGIVRLQLSRDGDGRLHAVATARALGDDPATWRAVSAPFPHPGAPLPGGPKLSQRLQLALAADAARAARVEEALLFDSAGRLVEGARSNVVIEAADGVLATPPAGRGAVAGVALEVLGEALAELRRRDVSRRDLLAARAVVAVNAVRGARPLAVLDAAPLGAGGDALARRLAAVLDRAGAV